VGTSLTVTSEFTDAGTADSHTVSYDWGDGSTSVGDVTESGGSGTTTDDHTYDSVGSFTVTVTVKDDDLAEGSSSTTVTLVDPHAHEPVIAFAATGPATEGTAYATTGQVTEPDGDTPVAATVDYDDGTGPHALTLGSGGAFTLIRTYPENGTHTVTVAADDGHGHSASFARTVTVSNAAPVVAAPSGPASGVTGATLSVGASFSDSGVQDAHTATYAWGDGTTSSGAVTESPGSGSVSGSHAYASPGSYPVTVTVADDDGGATSRTFGPVTVSPSETHLGKGSGQFASPKKSSRMAHTKKGKASFSFDAGTRGAPYGAASFTFKAGKIAFAGTTVTAASVAGSTLSMTVAGTQKGKAGYTLVLTAVDGGAGKPDLVRIRIMKGSKTVYDSQPGQPAGKAPTTKVKHGQVVFG
jgi:hypothetical protein